MAVTEAPPPPALAPGEMTEDDEKAHLEMEEREREAAEQQLSFPVGGIRPTKFRIQLTGGAVELPPSKAGLFQKDTEVDIVVAGITLSGWVKTDKNTTEKKGGVAVREAVIVLEGGDD
jgi:hypothetical protein